MSVSLLQIIEEAGYNLSKIEDCYWLKSKSKEWDELLDKAEVLVNWYEEAENERLEKEYNERWRDEP